MTSHLTKLALFAAILLGGCASSPVTQAPFSTEEWEEAKRLSLAQVETGKTAGCLGNMANLWMERRLPALGNCTTAGGKVVLYLQIESNGMVSNVLGDPWNARSRCYAKAYKGITVLQPPVDPFFFKLQLF